VGLVLCVRGGSGGSVGGLPGCMVWQGGKKEKTGGQQQERREREQKEGGACAFELLLPKDIPPQKF